MKSLALQAVEYEIGLFWHQLGFEMLYGTEPIAQIMLNDIDNALDAKPDDRLRARMERRARTLRDRLNEQTRAL